MRTLNNGINILLFFITGDNMNTYIFAFLVILFWGSAPIFGKLGLTKLDPTIGLAVRSFVISAIMLVYLFFTKQISSIAQADLKSLSFVAVEGILASLLGHLAYYYALKYGQVSQISPLIAAFPIVTVTLAVLFLGESFTWNKFLGAAFIIIGVILVKK